MENEAVKFCSNETIEIKIRNSTILLGIKSKYCLSAEYIQHRTLTDNKRKTKLQGFVFQW